MIKTYLYHFAFAELEKESLRQLLKFIKTNVSKNSRHYP
jgi:hypothetical protein